MTDATQQTQPLPTSVRGVLANYIEPLNYASSFLLATTAAPWVGGPKISAVWDLVSIKTDTITLTGDIKFETPVNIERVPGTIFMLDINQDTIGGWKAHWGSAFAWDGNDEPVLASGPGARTLIEFYCTGLHMIGKVFYRTPETSLDVSTV